MSTSLPTIPAKRYFTIGEVAELCDVKPHVLRYWEQEFTQLRPMKRRGNRRYYQHHEVLMIRRIRELLYEHGFTISGARSRLQNSTSDPLAPLPAAAPAGSPAVHSQAPQTNASASFGAPAGDPQPLLAQEPAAPATLRQQLLQIRALLCPEGA
ncbi:hypothetical protein AAV94_02355 [Lampropedia cohaerens]|uniref:HTH merR-type domain-containing protein n=1 Tax=Lampropedia cohaerens TaxID=1610491 RepID=A0A0U1Q2J2_9BURK|nr:MerR family transcriptional regulator [Lampropedia cohaerens]KKW68956.1 hypothetical protein AAV94_02355 [Lampropedia cohaerens]